MIGGIYFAGAPFAGMLRAAGAAAATLAGSASLTFSTAGALDLPPSYLAADVTISVTADGTLDNPPAYLAGDATIDFDTSGQLIVPIETGAGISIGGVDVTGRVRVSGLTVHDILNDAPNTATFTIEGDAPAVGQRVRIMTGDVLLFTGAVQTIDQAYESLPKHLAWHISAIDDTAEANARRPFGTWFDTSATTIAQSLVTNFAPAFSIAGIEAGLPTVTIVFDGADPFIQCLTRLATAVGGYCKIEDHVVYLFTEDTTAPPDPIDDAHRFLMSPPVTVNTDSSQLRTRVYGKGYGETVPADINAGETLLPIQDGVMFPPLGGTAIVSLTADGAQSDKIAFTGVVLKAGGTLVGTGSAPTTAPVATLTSGTGIESGPHEWAYVFVTATGTSLPSPRATVVVGLAGNPAAMGAVFGYEGFGTGLPPGYRNYAYTFKRADGAETALSPRSYGSSAATGAFDRIFTQGGASQPPLPAIPSGYVRQWYRTATVSDFATLPTDPSAFKRIPVGGTFSDGAGTTWQSGVEQLTGVDASFMDGSTDASLGATAPTVGAGNRVLVTVPAGPSNTTDIEIYRTPLGSSQLKKVTNVGSNTATTITDSTPDAGLTTNAPTSDTSGLRQPEGQVNPGAPVLPVASPAPFRAAGGWVTLGGGQVVRYTAISGNTLTGIPATGSGAITTTVIYGQQAIPAPMLIGVTGLARPMLKGSAVHIWVQRDDLLAQSEQAARTGGNGIVEFLIVDNRRGVDSLVARCDADLALFSRPIVTVGYATRDLKTKSGKPVVINLPSQRLATTLTIQDVTITEIDIATGLAPRFTVRASSVRFSLEDTLRRLIAGGQTEVNA